MSKPCWSAISASTADGLLPRLLDGEFAVADAGAEPVGEGGRRFLAVSGHEFRHRREQASLRQAVAIDTVDARLGPGLVQIGQGDPLLFMVRQRLARVHGTSGGGHPVLLSSKTVRPSQTPSPNLERDVITRKPRPQGTIKERLTRQGKLWINSRSAR